MSYENLLTVSRFRGSSVQGRTLLTEAESDRGRLLFCAAFRRLQQKAQVFSMEPNAAVRSRLTHSFEVSQIGRYIATLISSSLLEEKTVSTDQAAAMVTFVENACLMHDIGNPPFGHFGEAAIRDWFKKNGLSTIKSACKMSDSDIEGVATLVRGSLSDFEEFDGNPQGLRVVTKLQWNNDEFGLNLTHTTLAAYLKYLRSSDEDPCKGHYKKAGFFLTEKDVVESIWGALGYPMGKRQRFPLAYVMEAADDIAYCISDLEDSIEKGLVNELDALGSIKNIWLELCAGMEYSDKYKEIKDCLEAFDKKSGDYTYTNFRTSLNRVLVEYAAEQYKEQHERILDGTADSLIPEKSPAGIVLTTLKNFCRENVYCHEEVQRVELSGYAAIYGLMEKFKCLLECSEDRFQKSMNYENRDLEGHPIVIEKKLLSLFPKKYIKVYKKFLEGSGDKEDSHQYIFDEWRHRAHLVVDFVSGMTDDYAMNTYRVMSGMRNDV